MPRISPGTVLQLSPVARGALECRAPRYRGQANLSVAANAMIERYAALLATGAATYASDYTQAERMLLRDVLNGTMLTPDTIACLWVEVADAEEEGVGEKWGVSVPDLVAKLNAAPLHELHAIADDVETWWRKQSGAP